MGRSAHLRRSVAASALAAVLVGALLTGCGDDGEPDISVTTTRPEDTSVTTVTAVDDASAGTTTGVAPPTTDAPGSRIDVTVTDGEVTGGGRIAVEKDQPVTLRVTSDADDEVHVHGFDLTFELVAGETGELVFTPDASGIYEVELHDDGTVLLELEVR